MPSLLLVGQQTPRIESLPAGLVPSDEAVTLCKQLKLGLDEWQDYVLSRSTAERKPGLFAAFQVGLIVPRQNGKGKLLEARELAGMLLFGERLLIHTAHELRTAQEAQRRMLEFIESNPDLDALVKKVLTANGRESIEFRNGSRIKYMARSEKSGRGFSGDLVVLDEAQFITPEIIGALLPTMAAVDNPQIWLTASAGDEDAIALKSVRNRAQEGGDQSLAYFEWSAPDDADLDDREAWAMANPAMGIRITDEFITRERAAMDEEEFARERLGLWGSVASMAVIDADAWMKLTRDHELPEVKMVPKSGIVFAVDVPPDRKTATIVASGLNAEGTPVVEVIDRQQGQLWAVDRLVHLNKMRGASVALDPQSPAGGLIADLQAAGIEPVMVSGTEMARACSGFDTAIREGKLLHIGQALLNTAVAAARRKKSGDSWYWQRSNASADISPLVAATVAYHVLRSPANDPRSIRARRKAHKPKAKAAFF